MKERVRRHFITPILLSYGLIFLLAFSAAFWGVSRIVSRSILAQEIEKYKLSTASLLNNLATQMENISNITLLPYYNADIMKAIENYGYDGNTLAQVEQRVLLENFLYTMISTQKDIAVLSFMIDGQLLSVSRGVLTGREAEENEESEWYKEICEADGKAVFLHMPSSVQSAMYHKDTILVGRLLKNLENKEKLGAVLVDVDISSFLRLFSTLRDATVMMTDAQGKRITDNGNPLLDNEKYVEYLLSSDSQLQTSSFGGVEYLILRSRCDFTDWELVYAIEVRRLLYSVDNIQFYLLFLLLGSAALSLLVAALFGKRLSKRLQLLLDGMDRFKNGETQVYICDTHRDEIALLSTEFNDMVAKINRLIFNLSVLQLKQRDAELEALKSKINPHFIYNTLESIQMYAVIHDQRELANMVAALGKLLRSSLKKDENFCYVKEEIEFVKLYLDLLKIRYGDKFSYEIDVEPQVLEKRIMRLLLQPIVENAIVHGLENKVGAGWLTVTGKCEGEKLIFTICDDGVGMDADTLKRIQCPNGEPVQSTQSIGISNVRERIALYYGEGYGLTIDSNQGTGTTVRIVVASSIERKPF